MSSRNSHSSNGGGRGRGIGRNGGNNGSSNGMCRHNRKTPDDVAFERRINNKCWWMHGGCTYMSTECTRQENWSKTDTTLASRMGGSNAFCEWWCDRDTVVNKLNTTIIKFNVLSTPWSKISSKKLCIAKDDNAASHRYWRKEDKEF